MRAPSPAPRPPCALGWVFVAQAIGFVAGSLTVILAALVVTP